MNYEHSISHEIVDLTASITIVEIQEKRLQENKPLEFSKKDLEQLAILLTRRKDDLKAIYHTLWKEKVIACPNCKNWTYLLTQEQDNTYLGFCSKCNEILPLNLSVQGLWKINSKENNDEN